MEHLKHKIKNLLVGLAIIILFSFCSSQNVFGADADSNVGMGVEVLDTSVSIFNVSSTPAAHSADVSWETNIPASCRVDWREENTSKEGSTSYDSAVLLHSLDFTNLTDGTRYFYTIYCTSSYNESITAETEEKYFDTPFDVPVFSVEVNNRDDVTFHKKTIPYGQVTIIVTGEDNFTFTVDADTQGDWRSTKYNLNPGDYQVKIYVTNSHGAVSPYSEEQNFTVKKEDTKTTEEPSDEEPSDEEPPAEEPPAEPVIPPTEPPTEPETLPGEEIPVETEVPGNKGIIADIAKAISSISKKIAEVVKDVPEVIKKNQSKVIASELVAIGFSFIPILIQVNSIKDLLLLFQNAFFGIMNLFVVGWKRKWGIVYDTSTGKPIPFAVVDIYTTLGRKVDSRITDRYGAYSFLVSPGEYKIQVEKKGYQISDPKNNFRTFYADSYLGEELKYSRHDIIEKDIPMDPEEVKKRIGIEKHLFFSFLSSVLFYLGFALAIVFVFVNPGVISFLLLMIYIVSSFVRFSVFGKIAWGTVAGLSAQDRSFVLIQAFDKKTGALAARTVSDEVGRYYMILDQGTYNISARGMTGKKWDGEMDISKRRVVRTKIRLE